MTPRQAILVAAYDKLEADCAAASAALKALSGGGLMGLTPDSVKASEQYQAARKAYDNAFAALRGFNSLYARLLPRKERVKA